jgi:hypothetical protein
MKFIKVNALEIFGLHKLNDKREKELYQYKKLNYFNIISSIAYFSAPIFFMTSIILTYTYYGSILRPELIYPTF